MTLTTVVGSSGSGKTTFLNDVYKRHQCIYIRQFHTIRPYIVVSKIPNFYPIQLPYWDIYTNEKNDTTIQVGGTMAGTFTAGLSGGQRKLLLFELIYQRVMTTTNNTTNNTNTSNQKDLLIVLDEPFAGVTDDFVPFIIERLQELRKVHNVLLVTNDHIESITEISDNTITVSAIDRFHVRINDRENVDRDKAIAALSIGNNYQYTSSGADLQFFWNVEIWKNHALLEIIVFTIIAFMFILVSFWNSNEDSAALILVGAEIITYFCLNPYLLTMVDWRIAIQEEAEALVHSSKGMSKLFKTILILTLIFFTSLMEYGFINAVVDGKSLSSFPIWLGIFCDSASGTFPLIALGIFTNLSSQMVEVLGSIPFLLMTFFSTTFSPGSGIPGFKELRYLFTRFYLWCLIPGVQTTMEGCPTTQTATVVYIIVSSLVGVFIFLVCKIIMKLQNRSRKRRTNTQLLVTLQNDIEFRELQIELYGVKALRRFQNLQQASSRSMTDE